MSKILILLLSVLFSAPLLANDVDDLLDQLSAPSAVERAKATVELSKVKASDLNWRMRQRWNDNLYNEQVGMLNVAGIRQDDVLLKKALAWENDEEKRPFLLSYVLALKEEDLLAQDPIKMKDLLQFRAIYLLTYKAASIYVSDYRDSSPSMYSELRTTAGIRQAALQILMGSDTILEGLQLALREIAENEHIEHSSDRRAISADMKLALSVINYNPWDPDKDEPYWGVMILRYIQIEAVKFMGFTGMVEYTQSINLMIPKYASAAEDRDIDYAFSREEFLDAIRVSLYQLNDQAPLLNRIASLKKSIKAIDLAAGNKPMVGGPQLGASFSDRAHMAKIMLRAEMFDDAAALYKELVSEARLVMVTAGNWVFQNQAKGILPVMLYNLACCESMQLKLTKSLEHLKEAVKMGFKSWKWMIIDSDLYAVRLGEPFREWFEEVAPPSVWDEFNETSED